MTHFNYAHRHPDLVLRREGVEDEKEKAARILALCQDKPIRKIRSTADIPVGQYRPIAREWTAEQGWSYR